MTDAAAPLLFGAKDSINADRGMYPASVVRAKTTAPNHVIVLIHPILSPTIPQIRLNIIAEVKREP